MKISVLVVSLNAGDTLKQTVDSILAQKNADFEIVIKDGGSTDGSLEQIPADARIRVISQKDSGIYDAMNQAAGYADGDYAMYMNCGDRFYREDVLKNICIQISEKTREKGDRQIFYGDCYVVNRDYILRYPEIFSDYICFTMVLCHQATVYPCALLRSRPFAGVYKMAADYEYYVYAYQNGWQLTHIPVVVASYEGNGASETQKNRRLALEERKQIQQDNFSKKQIASIRRKMLLRGDSLKQFLVGIEWFYPIYSKLAKVYYSRKK